MISFTFFNVMRTPSESVQDICVLEKFFCYYHDFLFCIDFIWDINQWSFDWFDKNWFDFIIESIRCQSIHTVRLICQNIASFQRVTKIFLDEFLILQKLIRFHYWINSMSINPYSKINLSKYWLVSTSNENISRWISDFMSLNMDVTQINFE